MELVENMMGDEEDIAMQVEVGGAQVETTGKWKMKVARR